MSAGVTGSLPDVGELFRLQGEATSGLDGLLGALAGLDPSRADSPVGSIVDAVGELEGLAGIDLSAFEDALPRVLSTIGSAAPAGALEHVATLGETYERIRGQLAGSPLAEAAADGDLQGAALAVIDELVTLFLQRLGELPGNVLDDARLERLRAAFTALEGLEDDFPANAAELPAFLSEQLLGVAPDLLDPLTGHVDAGLVWTATLDPSVLDEPRRLVREAWDALVAEVESFDPASAEGYTGLETLLDAFEAAWRALADALAQIYGQAGDALDTFDPTAFIDTHAERLGAVLASADLGSVVSIDDIVNDIEAALEAITARFDLVIDAGDAGERLAVLGNTLSESVAASPVGQVREVLEGFLGEVTQLLEGVPTEEIGDAVRSMIATVQEQIDALGIDGLADTIETAFTTLESRATELLGPGLSEQVSTALQALAGRLESLPIASLTAQIQYTAAQLEGLVNGLDQLLGEHLDSLGSLTDQLEELSFRPVTDVAVGEMDDIRDRLRAINPAALSDIERVAISAAMAVLEALDLEDQVFAGLRVGFGDGHTRLRGLLVELTARLASLRERLGELDPAAVLEPVDTLLENAGELVGRLNAVVLLRPLRERADALVGELERLSPGALLDPLAVPYDAAAAAFDELDPARWTAPLGELFSQVDGLIGRIDVRPVFTELDRRRGELLGEAANALANAFLALDLPPPLDTFFDALGDGTGSLGAFLTEPAAELERRRALAAEIRFDTLFEPLDALWERLLGLVDTVPAEALTDAVNVLREGVGRLEELDPAVLVARGRVAVGELDRLAPGTLLGLPLALPRLRLRFAARIAAAPPERAADGVRVTARFDAVLAVADPAAAASRRAEVEALYTALRERLAGLFDSLDASAAAAAFDELHRELRRLLPDFLESPEPLDPEAIRLGLLELRPSRHAARLNEVAEHFLARLRPVSEALDSGFGELFAAVEETLRKVDPLALVNELDTVYETLYAKLLPLDPAAYTPDLQALFDPLRAALGALDPRVLGARLDLAWDRALKALRDGVAEIFDAVAATLGVVLGQVRAGVEGIVAALRSVAEAAADLVRGLIARVDDLVFARLLGRLEGTLENLRTEFEVELERARGAFDEMLAAIPGASGSASAAVSLG